MNSYIPAPNRYDRPQGWFRHCGTSGLRLPAISLGCWHNFGSHQNASGGFAGEASQHRNCQQMLFRAFDLGITHFDLANNYGPPPGSAEARVGLILQQDLRPYRDELLISSKAGYDMWPGPYGSFGSRKSIIASCDQSLKRLRLDYVDLFYSHRFDPNTPLEETMGALDTLVRSGRALYVGISNYNAHQTREALRVCAENGFARPVIHQMRFNLLDRAMQRGGLDDVLVSEGLGGICFSPLQGGLLSGRYLAGVPRDSRAGLGNQRLRDLAADTTLNQSLFRCQERAQASGRSLTQFALRWALQQNAVSSVLIGASRIAQIEEAAAFLDQPDLDPDTLAWLDEILPPK